MKLINLIEIRKDNKLNQTKIAKYLYMSLTKYHSIETGKIPMPASDLIKLSYLFNIRSEFILGVFRKRIPLTKEERNEIKKYLDKINFKPNLYLQQKNL